MKVFVWAKVEKVTDRYHPDGGLVVFAETEERARELANAQSGCELKPTEAPDEVRDVVGGEEKVFIDPPQGNPRFQSREELRVREARHVEYNFLHG